jgi:hypothetical protein
VGEPTTFSSDFRNDPDGFPLWQLVPGKSYAADFQRSDGEGGYNGWYDYEYFQDAAGDILFGERWEDYYAEGTETGSIWLPTGDRLDLASSREPGPFVPLRKVGDSGWDPGVPPPDVNYFTTPPGNPADWDPMWSDTWDSNAIAPTGNISGILGGTEDLWSATQAAPANFGIAGILEPMGPWEPQPFLFGVPILSSDITSGAYAGYLGGLFYNVNDAVIESGISDLMGTSYALYIDPNVLPNSYQTGVIHGPFSGSVYWDTYFGENAAALWDGTGTMVPIPLGITEISPEDLRMNPEAFLDEGFFAGWLYGTQGGTEIGGFGWGDTLALAGHDDFGIFNMFFGYDNFILGSGDVTAMVAGWAEFGTHPILEAAPAPDIGMYVFDPMTITRDGELLLADYTGQFLTYSKIGLLFGDFIGAQQTGTESWLGATAGYWQTSQALAFNGIFEGDLWGMVDMGDGEPFFTLWNTGWTDGLAGGLDPLWAAGTADPARLHLLGESSENDAAWWTTAPPVFATNIRSYNPWDDTPTIWNQADNFHNGAYYGYTAGRATELGTAEGGILALGLDPNGNLNFLLGDLNVAIYPDQEILIGDGSMFPVQVLSAADTGLTYDDAANFYPGGLLTETREWWWWQGDIATSRFLDANDTPIGGDMNITDQMQWGAQTGGVTTGGDPWALAAGSVVVGGTYNAPAGGESNFWEMAFTDDRVDTKQYGVLFSSNETELTRGEWQDGRIAGKGYGAWVSWDYGVTGISGGDIKGTFDPNTRTWQMAALFAAMDTKTFANLMATPEGREKLKLLNMPYVQVGQTTLSQGGGTVNGMQNVTMNDVKFLAYSTGGAPRAFMSPDVNGQHDGSVVAGGPAVPLTGAQGVSADFQVNRWDGPGGNWGADITGGGTYTGTGSMNGTTVEMNGFGAGTIGSDTFSGTAAGTAKPGVVD